MIPIKIMLAGDTHGEFPNVKHKIDLAKKIGDIQRIVILGDFGLWWGFDAVKFLDEINDYAKAKNVQVFAIPGNHENYEWWESIIDNAPATSHGWAYVRTHVLLSPRVHEFRWNNKQFVVAGGAVSIDKDWREEYRRQKGKRIWSPREQLTDAEVEELENWTRGPNSRPVDYLLTHDCSDFTPWKSRIKPDIDSQIHRQRIDRVIRAVKPKYHFHGHMHERYEWLNTQNTDAFGATPEVEVMTYGLECNLDPDSWGVLDLVTDEFKWPRDLLAWDELVAIAKGALQPA